MFHIKAFKHVTHSDRDTEFIMLKNEITGYLTNKYFDTITNSLMFGNRSCEMIAEELISAFGLSACEVSEDNENGAIVYNDSTK
jgi:hypothetical protein